MLIYNILLKRIVLNVPPNSESSATNTLERPLKRRKSRGSRGSRNKRKGDAAAGGGGGEITPKRQSREYRDEVNRDELSKNRSSGKTDFQ